MLKKSRTHAHLGIHCKGVEEGNGLLVDHTIGFKTKGYHGETLPTAFLIVFLMLGQCSLLCHPSNMRGGCDTMHVGWSGRMGDRYVHERAEARASDDQVGNALSAIQV